MTYGQYWLEKIKHKKNIYKYTKKHSQSTQYINIFIIFVYKFLNTFVPAWTNHQERNNHDGLIR